MPADIHLKLRAEVKEAVQEFERGFDRIENEFQQTRRILQQDLNLDDEEVQKFAAQVDQARNTVKVARGAMIEMRNAIDALGDESVDSAARMDRLNRSFDALRVSGDAAGRSVTALRQKADTLRGASDSVDRLKGSTAAAAVQFRLLKAAALGFFALRVTQIVTQQIQKFLDYEAAISAASRALTVATGSQRKANEELQFARDLAEELGSNYLELTDGFAKVAFAAKTAGVAQEDVRKTTEALAGASRVLNLSAEQTGGIFTALEQILSKGRLQSEELRRQLGNRLPGAFQIAAEAMGLTTAQLEEQIRLGEIAANEFLPRFADAVQEAYGPQVAAAADDLRGAVNRLQNTFVELNAEAARAAETELKDGIEELTDLMEFFAPTVRESAKAVGFLASNIELVTIGAAAFFAAMGPISAVIATVAGTVALVTKATREYAKAIEDTGPQLLRLADGTFTLVRTTQEQKDAHEKARDAMEAAQIAAKILTEEQAKLKASTEAVTEEVEQQEEAFFSLAERLAMQAEAELESLRRIDEEARASARTRIAIGNDLLEAKIDIEQVATEQVVGEINKRLQNELLGAEERRKIAMETGEALSEIENSLIEQRTAAILEYKEKIKEEGADEAKLREELQAELAEIYQEANEERAKLLEEETEKVREEVRKQLEARLDEINKRIKAEVDAARKISSARREANAEALEEFGAAADSTPEKVEELRSEIEDLEDQPFLDADQVNRLDELKIELASARQGAGEFGDSQVDAAASAEAMRKQNDKLADELRSMASAARSAAGDNRELVAEIDALEKGFEGTAEQVNLNQQVFDEYASTLERKVRDSTREAKKEAEGLIAAAKETGEAAKEAGGGTIEWGDKAEKAGEQIAKLGDETGKMADETEKAGDAAKDTASEAEKLRAGLEGISDASVRSAVAMKEFNTQLMVAIELCQKLKACMEDRAVDDVR